MLSPQLPGNVRGSISTAAVTEGKASQPRVGFSIAPQQSRTRILIGVGPSAGPATLKALKHPQPKYGAPHASRRTTTVVVWHGDCLCCLVASSRTRRQSLLQPLSMDNERRLMDLRFAKERKPMFESRVVCPSLSHEITRGTFPSNDNNNIIVFFSLNTATTIGSVAAGGSSSTNEFHQRDVDPKGNPARRSAHNADNDVTAVEASGSTLFVLLTDTAACCRRQWLQVHTLGSGDLWVKQQQ